MTRIDERAMVSYLQHRFGVSARLIRLAALGHDGGAADVKGYGYGVPVRVDYEVAGEQRSAVLETITPGPFGHEHMADRAQLLLWSYDAYNRLPRHVRSLDVGAFLKDGTLRSIGGVEEFFGLNEFAEGVGYNSDLERLRDTTTLSERDVARSDSLCDYLVDIHRIRGPDSGLYVRRLRELVGHHECIMGILDAYPDAVGGFTSAALKTIEHACVDWRWRLKQHSHRLRQVHGDFHPWNILFREDDSFVVIDRSRGEWGDPADDLAALTINYLFFSLQRSQRLDGNLETLFTRFWRRYLDATGDDEILAVIGPFFAFRGLVVANPLWYPTLPDAVRSKLLNFVRAVLACAPFDPGRANEYCDRGGMG